ncbi:mechanosensitive ion channel family protein [Clostridium gasigenes]|uniref:Mechanosensitive ion channel n=1 Tax=Clostridium gasigenes TaxID=94869 RepID=A0A1H0W7Q6_9CLOT|nr:mechanosensitive ion channel domain-containing protein [Clostridium gasigenes]MBB6625505.1 mechanosensitive ion channel [Clostridium gasigenes]MBB6714553.1 mechanosensitive ion channel [Clostridium gasigenes]MBU3090418.1 mechanosensitive ion channel [Clostridium gasigenes]SDP86613.1 small conductance mechanosensitive channel [Clostridium gasigenes]
MDITKISEQIIFWASTNGLKLIIGLISLFIGFKLINKVIIGFRSILEKQNVEATLITFLDGLCESIMKILLVIFILGYIGIPTTGFAALIASAGLAVGLALQGSLSNFAGGVILLFIKPFKVGDYIEANGRSGTVESIKIFYTNLVTNDNKSIVIPNGTLSNGIVVNYTAKDTRRVDLVFAVAYTADILHVKKVLTEIVNKHNLILNVPEPFIAINEHGSSSVNFVLRAWCKTEDYLTVYFDLLEKVKIKFDNEEIDIPYPQMDIHMK